MEKYFKEKYANLELHLNKIRIILIIIFLLLIVIMLTHSLFVIGRINNIPTGNIDIFYILGDTTSNNTNLNFYAGDKKSVWNSENVLNIFSNPAYKMRSIIAPESANSYEFYLVNNNNFALTYDIEFGERNLNDINMKYRLRKNGTYIAGSENTWVSYNKINFSGIKIDEYSNDKFFLDWKWFESNNDTHVGTNINSNYSLFIKIYAEQML